jgi:hypothetical protein
MPRSLDGDGKPPSPAFTIPASGGVVGRDRQGSGSSQRKSSHGSLSRVENDLNVFTPSKDIRPRPTNPFAVMGLGKLVGGERGLDDSVYNPNRGSEREKVPLLSGDGDDGGASVS